MITISNSEIIGILAEIIKKYLSKSIDEHQTVMELVMRLNPEEIYNITDEPMITDCYFAIKHLEEEGFETTKAELQYFLECFTGIRQYNLDEKNKCIERSEN